MNFKNENVQDVLKVTQQRLKEEHNLDYTLEEIFKIADLQFIELEETVKMREDFKLDKIGRFLNMQVRREKGLLPEKTLKKEDKQENN